MVGSRDAPEARADREWGRDGVERGRRDEIPLRELGAVGKAHCRAPMRRRDDLAQRRSVFGEGGIGSGGGVVTRGARLARLRDPDQLSLRDQRKGAVENRIGNAEYRGRRPDPERQRDDGGEGVRGRSAERTRAVTHVLRKLVPPARTPAVPDAL